MRDLSKGWGLGRVAQIGCLVACLSIMAWALGFFSARLGTITGTGTSTLQAQLSQLRDDPLPAGQPRYVFVGLALSAREEVFDADIRLVDHLLRNKIGSASYRSVLLSNQRLHGLDRDLPVASFDHLGEVFRTLAATKRPEDRFIVLVSSHGDPDSFEVNLPALYPVSRTLEGRVLGQWAEQLAPNKTWFILSSCYSGSNLKFLPHEHVISMSASAADRNSFGCAPGGKNTWFVQSLARAMEAEYSFDALWHDTQARVEKLERSAHLLASRPQIQFGGAFKGSGPGAWYRF